MKYQTIEQAKKRVLKEYGEMPEEMALIFVFKVHRLPLLSHILAILFKFHGLSFTKDYLTWFLGSTIVETGFYYKKLRKGYNYVMPSCFKDNKVGEMEVNSRQYLLSHYYYFLFNIKADRMGLFDSPEFTWSLNDPDCQ